MPAHSSNIGFDWQDVAVQSFSRNIKGTFGDDLMVGDNNGDIFTGKGGNDTMIGGTGDDLFRDGPGTDVISGGGGFDRLSFGFYSAATQGGSVDLATGVVHDGFGNVETETGISFVGFGTMFADTFTGGAAPAMFWAGHGDLVIGGSAGDDVFMVNDAPALIVGGAGTNTLMFSGGRFGPPDPNDTSPFPQFTPEAATHGVSVDLSRGLVLEDGFGGSGALVNIQNVVGGPLDDLIVGDAQDNVLAGAGGNDTLTGGAGNDVFLFDTHAYDWDGNPIPNGHDVITDFKPGQDHIAIDEPGVAGMADLTISRGYHGDIVITYGPNHDTVELLGVHHVTASDFIFGPV